VPLKKKGSLTGRAVAARKRTTLSAQLPTVIFDGDDTLWQTMPLYNSAKAEFRRLMSKQSFDPVYALNEFEKIDIRNVDRLGFSQKRLPTSLVETYRLLCRETGRVPLKHVETRLCQIADSVFSKRATLIRGAADTLQALSDFRLILLTKGERSIQQRRVEESGLKNFFTAVHIVPIKQEAEFEKLIIEERINKLMSWSVGDSLRSDVKPALAAGLSAIWIPTPTWSYESTATPFKHKRLYICRAITEVPSVIKRP